MINRFVDIRKWAADRNLLAGSTPQKQFIKLMEEFGELCAGLARGDIERTLDGVGDCAVVLEIILGIYGVPHLDAKAANEACKIIDYNQDDTVIVLTEMIASLGYDIRIPFGIKNIKFHGDKIILYLAHLCILLGYELSMAVEVAWDEIKDRKGRMIDGIFVKEADL